ncbi:MAG: class I SAM-dependent methyltransferase [Planctomycetota bacterium]
MSDFNADQYWEQRLEKSYDETGVGRRGWGVAFNRWAYRARRRVFDRVMRTHVRDASAISALDIGSGTGVYIRALLDHNVKSVHGIDLTDVAVKNLRQRFPNAAFERGDIGDEDLTLTIGPVQLITIMDVMFHIVDDARYQTALRAMVNLLDDDGVLIMTDGFLNGSEQRLEHIVHRDAATIDRWCTAAGLELVDRRPFLVLMNDPVGPGHRLLKSVRTLVEWVLKRVPGSGMVLGPLLYVPERVLASTLSHSPSTHISVYRKRD